MVENELDETGMETSMRWLLDIEEVDIDRYGHDTTGVQEEPLWLYDDEEDHHGPTV